MAANRSAIASASGLFFDPADRDLGHLEFDYELISAMRNPRQRLLIHGATALVELQSESAHVLRNCCRSAAVHSMSSRPLHGPRGQQR